MFWACSENRVGFNDIGSIKGKVVEMGTNVPLANVRISTQPITSTVFTDSLGNFLIENAPVGDYSVQARKDDYIASFEPASVISDATVEVVFELVPSTANNRPPDQPILISPSEGQVLDTTVVTFKWRATDPENDDLTFAIELRNDKNADVERFEDIMDTIFTYDGLMLGTQYFWQVAANDGINESVLSEIGTFSVIMAPEDNRFLFVRNIDGNNVIFSSDENANEFMLTDPSKNSYNPRTNVAAGRIAYLQTTGAQVDIFTMNRDGTDKQQVTLDVKPNGFDLNEINFSWPENSDRIYFPNFDKLYRIRTNGQGLIEYYRTIDGSLISEVDVDQEHQIIALKTNNLDGYNINIFTINFQGDLLNTVLTGVTGASSGLNLSVTGQKLIYAYDVSGFESFDYRRLDSRIFEYDLNTNMATDISYNKPAGTNDLDPVYSPNEAQVIFTNTSNDGISQQNVFTLEIGDDTSRAQLFTNAFMPDWE